MDRIHAGTGLGRLQSMEKTHAGAEEKCEEETVAEGNCCMLTTIPLFPIPLYCLGVEGIEEP